MSNNQFTTTRFPVRTIPLVTTPRRRFVELLAASILGAALALVAAWLLFTPAAPRAANEPPVPAIVLITATAPLPTAAPTVTPTATAIPTEEPTQEAAPVGRAEPIQEAAPAVAVPTWFPTTVAAWCESGCDGGVGPVELQPAQESVPTPDPRTAPTSEVTVICPPAPCPDPPDLEFAATIQALPPYNAHPLPPVQPVNVDQAGRAGA